MATASVQLNTNLFEQNIFNIINDLKDKHKRADADSIHRELIKITNFKEVSKEDLQGKLDLLLIDEKLMNKINRNLNSYSVNTVNTDHEYDNIQLINSNVSIITPENDSSPGLHMATQTPLNVTETPITETPITKTNADFVTPEKKSAECKNINSSEIYIDKIYEKIKIENFKGDILKNVHKDIKELVNNEFTIFKYKCEELIESASFRYTKQLEHLQSEIKSKDRIIDQLLNSLTNLTNSEFESKNNIIQKLIDKNNIEGNIQSVRRRNDKNELTDPVKSQSDKSDYSNVGDSIKNIQEHVEKMKANGSPNKNKTNDEKVKSTPKKKIRVEIVGDSLLNGVQEKGMNKDSNMIIKVRKYPGATSTDILDHIRPTLRKEPDQILIHAGTNDIANDQNYLKNVKKIVKLVRETCKNTKLCFSSLICRTDAEDLNEKVMQTNTNLENYCKQQNLDFINNDNIKKSDLNSRGLHLHDRGSNRLAKNFLDYLY